MHADRWSPTAWIVALAIDVGLCVALAAGVCMKPPRPPLAPRYDEMAFPGETMCGVAYRGRLLTTIDALELERWSVLDEQATVTAGQARRVVDERYEEIQDRLSRIHRAYLHCDDLRRAEEILERDEARNAALNRRMCSAWSESGGSQCE